MDEYVKTLTITTKLEEDKASFNKLQKDVDKLKEKLFDKSEIDYFTKELDSKFNNLSIVKNGLYSSKEDLEELKKQFTLQETKLQEIAKLKQAIKEVEMYDKDSEKLTELKKKLDELSDEENELSDKSSDEDTKDTSFGSFVKGFKQGFKEMKLSNEDFVKAGKDTFDKLKDKIVSGIEEMVSSVISTLKEVSSWDITSSYTYNREATSMYTQYGLTGSEAYGWSKALETMFGSGSTIDTYFEALPTMNENQLKYLQELVDINKKNYESSIETSKAYQEFSTEYNLFKEEIQSTLIEFFQNNKDLIINFFKFCTKALQDILNVVSAIGNLFGMSSSSTSSDVLSTSSTTTNTNNSKSITLNNTYNGVGQTDQSWLANTGQMTYQQIIQALK